MPGRSRIVATGTQFFDANGELVRSYIHFTSTVDTFSANGHTLTGIPYAVNLEFRFENGQPTQLSASGVFEKVVLPDGTVWFSAGHAFNNVDVTTPIVLNPDVGISGDIDAFCAALAP